MDSLMERVHFGDAECAHLSDCYPRSLYLLGLVDSHLKTLMAANVLAVGDSRNISKALAESLGIDVSQVDYVRAPPAYQGDLYAWAQTDIKPETFVVVTLSGKQIGHAVLVGKVMIPEPKPHYEIVLVDTQRHLDGRYEYQYNIGRAQIEKYLHDLQFDPTKMGRLSLEIDIADRLSKLALGPKGKGSRKKRRERTRRRRTRRRRTRRRRTRKRT